MSRQRPSAASWGFQLRTYSTDLWMRQFRDFRRRQPYWALSLIFVATAGWMLWSLTTVLLDGADGGADDAYPYVTYLNTFVLAVVFIVHRLPAIPRLVSAAAAAKRLRISFCAPTTWPPPPPGWVPEDDYVDPAGSPIPMGWALWRTSSGLPCGHPREELSRIASRLAVRADGVVFVIAGLYGVAGAVTEVASWWILPMAAAFLIGGVCCTAWSLRAGPLSAPALRATATHPRGPAGFAPRPVTVGSVPPPAPSHWSLSAVGPMPGNDASRFPELPLNAPTVPGQPISSPWETTEFVVAENTIVSFLAETSVTDEVERLRAALHPWPSRALVLAVLLAAYLTSGVTFLGESPVTWCFFLVPVVIGLYWLSVWNRQRMYFRTLPRANALVALLSRARGPLRAWCVPLTSTTSQAPPTRTWPGT